MTESGKGLRREMRAVVQRVSRARVTVAEEIVGQIGRGLLVLLGATHADSEADADYLAGKIAGLRVFEDESGKMNLDAASVGGGILVVPQFTLYGDVRRGKRPSFDDAARPNAPSNSTNTSWNVFGLQAFPATPANSRR